MGGGGGTTNQQETINPEERALAQIADEQWVEYQSRYVPLENKWMAEIAQYNDPLNHVSAMGLAQNDYRQAAGANIGSMQQGVAGRRYSGLNANAIDDARGLANVGSFASQGVTDRYLSGIENIIKVGQGQQTQSLNGLQEIANTAVASDIAKRRNKWQTDSKKASIGGLAAGAAAGLATNSFR